MLRLDTVPPRRTRTGCEWTYAAPAASEWSEHLERCGGGFYHTPAGVNTAGTPGDLLALQLRRERRVVGLALGIRRRCRLSRSSHVYFPSLPALQDSVNRTEALQALAAFLRRQGVADVEMESFDARWQPSAIPGALLQPVRPEYVVQLSADPVKLLAQCGSNHRRNVRRGIREGLVLRRLRGQAARRLLAAVMSRVARRSAARGGDFTAELPQMRDSAAEPGDPWGSAVFSAWRGTDPLAAALVGWGGRETYYVAGGSTPEGYSSSAAVWMHWAIMSRLAERGYVRYNMGGTPRGAEDPDHPSHGLVRFKLGFGASVLECRSLDLTFEPMHSRLHTALQWVRSRAISVRAGRHLSLESDGHPSGRPAATPAGGRSPSLSRPERQPLEISV